jgi:hypothetical protein
VLREKNGASASIALARASRARAFGALLRVSVRTKFYVFLHELATICTPIFVFKGVKKTRSSAYRA